MDWISKLEKEKHEQEQERDRNKEEKAEELRKAEAAFSNVKAKLGPVIKSTIAEVNSRVGISLAFRENATSIEVTKIDKQASDLVNPHRLIVSNVSANGDSVLVQAIQARKLHRPELDDVDKSNWSRNKYNEMYGTDETIVEARAAVTDLLETDLQLLMEWLVKTTDYDERLGTPQIRAVRTKIENKEIHNNYGHWTLDKLKKLLKIK